MRHDLFNNVVHKTLFAPKAAVTDNTAQASAIIDTQDARGVLCVMTTGTNADSDATYTVLVQESDNSNMSSPSDVADENLQGTEAGAAFNFNDDGESIKIGVVPTKRYIQVTVTPVNNTGNVFLGGAALLVSPRGAPNTTQVQA